jgi:hypothetical protein
MHLKDIRASPIIDTIVHLSPHRSESKCIIISANIGVKELRDLIPPTIKIHKLSRKGLERWKDNLALTATYAKLWPNFRRVRKPLI